MFVVLVVVIAIVMFVGMMMIDVVLLRWDVCWIVFVVMMKMVVWKYLPIVKYTAKMIKLMIMPRKAATPKPPFLGIDRLGFCLSTNTCQNSGSSSIHILEPKKIALPKRFGAMIIPANTPILGAGTNNSNAKSEDFFVILTILIKQILRRLHSTENARFFKPSQAKGTARRKSFEFLVLSFKLWSPGAPGWYFLLDTGSNPEWQKNNQCESVKSVAKNFCAVRTKW